MTAPTTTDHVLYFTVPDLPIEALAAIIIGALVIGGALGIAGWVAIEIWSRIISIQAKRDQRDVAEQ